MESRDTEPLPDLCYEALGVILLRQGATYASEVELPIVVLSLTICEQQTKLVYAAAWIVVPFFFIGRIFETAARASSSSPD